MILTEKRDNVYYLTLNRPKKANALTQEMLATIEQTIDEAHADSELRGLVLTGTGDRVFCGGADLTEVQSSGSTGAEKLAYMQRWGALSDKLASLPALTVAALNGTCVGGGLVLALACDVRLCVDGASLFYPLLANKMLPSVQDVARLRALLGPARTKAILLGGVRISAETAHTWGLVDQVVTAQFLQETVEAYLQASRAASAGHVRAMSHLSNGDSEMADVRRYFELAYDSE